jgi:hypothetical protein
MEWRQTKTGEAIDEGLLQIYLYRASAQPGDWKLTVYLRAGVTIGGVCGGDQLVTDLELSEVINAAYEDEAARHECAVSRAENWLLDQANWLLSNEAAAAALAWRQSRGMW